MLRNSYALPELVHHHENGLLFTPGESDELAEDIDQLLADPERRACMGQQSLKIISEHDRARVLNIWEDLYRRLAIEFREAKVLRERQLATRKYTGQRGEAAKKATRSRIRRTGDIGFDRSPTKKLRTQTRKRNH